MAKQTKKKERGSIKTLYQARFEIILAKSKNSWDLPESLLEYIVQHFEICITKLL